MAAGMRKILVLYTSGVFDMQDLGRGFEVVQNPLDATLRSNALFHDAQLAGVPEFEDLLVLPQLRPIITYRVLQYEDIIDSSDMSTGLYARMAGDLLRHYREYDGFVILHGTDTLAYTAAALSFMCENLGKPILLTGSQLPLRHLHSDARNNLLEALEIVGHYTIPEVAVLFDHRVFRGNRVSKTNSTAFRAFQSPNLPPLATLGVEINISWPIVLKPTELKPFSVCIELSSHVAILRLFPALSASTIAAYVAPPIEGVVLMTYGSGSVSNLRPDVLQVLRDAIQRGVIIVNVTQCLRGPVSSSSNAGSDALRALGVCPGNDMTGEAAVAKLMYICAKPWSLQQKLDAVQRSLRGELTERTEARQVKEAGKHLERLSDALGLQSIEKADSLQKDLLPMLMAAAIRDENTEVLMHLGSLIGHFQLADNTTGRTPLHHAAHFGSVACTELLLRNGALVNQTDAEGRTPLHLATRRGHAGVVQLLRATGAHLFAANPHELGALLCGLAAEGDAEGIVNLAMAGADLDAGDYDGRRALHVAVAAARSIGSGGGGLSVVSRLLELGASPDVVDNFGRTPRDEAAAALADAEGGEAGQELLRLLPPLSP